MTDKKMTESDKSQQPLNINSFGGTVREKTSDETTSRINRRYIAHKHYLIASKFKMRIFKKIRPSGKIIVNTVMFMVVLGIFLYILVSQINKSWVSASLTLLFLLLSLSATVLKLFLTYGVDVPRYSTKTEVQKARRKLYNSAKCDSVILVCVVMTIVTVVYGVTPTTQLNNQVSMNTQKIEDLENKLGCLQNSDPKNCINHSIRQKNP